MRHYKGNIERLNSLFHVPISGPSVDGLLPNYRPGAIIMILHPTMMNDRLAEE